MITPLVLTLVFVSLKNVWIYHHSPSPVSFSFPFQNQPQQVLTARRQNRTLFLWAADSLPLKFLPVLFERWFETYVEKEAWRLCGILVGDAMVVVQVQQQ